MFKILGKVFRFYYDWLRNLTPFWKKLWKLLGVKVIILVVFAYFIFPNILNEYYDNDTDRAKHVSKEILNPNQ